jgi:hypothetical protein
MDLLNFYSTWSLPFGISSYELLQISGRVFTLRTLTFSFSLLTLRAIWLLCCMNRYPHLQYISVVKPKQLSHFSHFLFYLEWARLLCLQIHLIEMSGMN